MAGEVSLPAWSSPMEDFEVADVVAYVGLSTDSSEPESFLAIVCLIIRDVHSGSAIRAFDTGPYLWEEKEGSVMCRR